MLGGRRELVLIAVLAGLLFAGCTSREVSSSAEVTEVSETPGGLAAETLFMEKCTYCHPLDTMSSKDKTGYGWKATVNRMIEKHGADKTPGLTEEDVEIVVDYLVKTY